MATDITTAPAIRFTSRLTRRGDYLVQDYRRDHTRCVDAETAAALCTRLNAESASCRDRAVAVAVAVAQEQHRFVTAHPDLTARQCGWQEWRGEQYNATAWAARKQAAHDRYVVSGLAAARPSDGERRAATVEREQYYYTTLCALDRATKDAIAARDAEAWRVALDRCDLAMASGPGY